MLLDSNLDSSTTERIFGRILVIQTYEHVLTLTWRNVGAINNVDDATHVTHLIYNKPFKHLTDQLAKIDIYDVWRIKNDLFCILCRDKY